jgi:hypothetical protein
MLNTIPSLFFSCCRLYLWGVDVTYSLLEGNIHTLERGRFGEATIAIKREVAAWLVYIG